MKQRCTLLLNRVTSKGVPRNPQIFFSDQTPSKQSELLEALAISDPSEMNWDVFPIDEWEFEPEETNPEQKYDQSPTEVA